MQVYCADICPCYTGEEYEVVENAIKSADRYYRVLSMEPAKSLVSADQMASAFKTVATSWMQQQQVLPCYEESECLPFSGTPPHGMSVAAAWFSAAS